MIVALSPLTQGNQQPVEQTTLCYTAGYDFVWRFVLPSSTTLTFANDGDTPISY